MPRVTGIRRRTGSRAPGPGHGTDPWAGPPGYWDRVVPAAGGGAADRPPPTM